MKLRGVADGHQQYLIWHRSKVFRRIGSCRAVNKRDLSTRETVGFGLNPGVAFATPQDLSSKLRESAASQNVRNVADTGERAVRRCCQQHIPSQLGRNRSGSIPTCHSPFQGSRKRLKMLSRRWTADKAGFRNSS
jgi:hypothetical protein